MARFNSLPLPLAHRFLLLAALIGFPLHPAAGQMQMAAPAGQPPAPEQLPAPERLSGIGNVGFPISANPQAQEWFTQGINLFFDFWDYESDRAFEQSIRSDPRCAMCYWGLYESESFGLEGGAYARDALDKALALDKHATARERLYIAAARAQEAAGPDDPAPAEEISILRTLVKKNPRDAPAAILLAEALEDGYDDGQPRSGQKEAIALLSGVLQREPDNSAANHLWIHAVEAGSQPQDALHSAEILASLAPASGHMVHMPGHIFYRLGDYAQAQAAFDASARVDESYMLAQHVSVDDDWNYVHNLMYSVANLLEAGRLRQAAQVSAKLTGARGVSADSLYPWSARDSIARINPQLPVALRTADWPQALEMAAETIQESAAGSGPAAHYPHLQLLAARLSDFARGMQAVEAGQLTAAEACSTQLDAGLWRISEELRDSQAGSPKTDAPARTGAMSADAQSKPMLRMLSIMSLELRGAIQAAKHQAPEARTLFAAALLQEKQLGYHEPPLYIRPVSETAGASWLAAGDWSAAEAAYRQALLERPNSGFPLYGIALSEERSGQTASASLAYRNFLAAWRSADPDLPQMRHAREWLAAHPAAADAPSGAE